MNQSHDNECVFHHITIMATTVVASIMKPTSVIKFQALPTTRAYTKVCYSIPFALIAVKSSYTKSPQARDGNNKAINTKDLKASEPRIEKVIVVNIRKSHGTCDDCNKQVHLISLVVEETSPSWTITSKS